MNCDKMKFEVALKDLLSSVECNRLFEKVYSCPLDGSSYKLYYLSNDQATSLKEKLSELKKKITERTILLIKGDYHPIDFSFDCYKIFVEKKVDRVNRQTLNDFSILEPIEEKLNCDELIEHFLNLSDKLEDQKNIENNEAYRKRDSGNQECESFLLAQINHNSCNQYIEVLSQNLKTPNIQHYTIHNIFYKLETIHKVTKGINFYKASDYIEEEPDREFLEAKANLENIRKQIDDFEIIKKQTIANSDSTELEDRRLKFQKDLLCVTEKIIGLAENQKKLISKKILKIHDNNPFIRKWFFDYKAIERVFDKMIKLSDLYHHIQKILKDKKHNREFYILRDNIYTPICSDVREDGSQLAVLDNPKNVAELLIDGRVKFSPNDAISEEVYVTPEIFNVLAEGVSCFSMEPYYDLITRCLGRKEQLTPKEKLCIFALKKGRTYEKQSQDFLKKELQKYGFEIMTLTDSKQRKSIIAEYADKNAITKTDIERICGLILPVRKKRK